MSTIKIKDADSGDIYFNVIGSGTALDPHQSVVPDYRIPYAIRQIEVNFGDTVSVYEKAKQLVKFGSNPELAAGVEETVWSTGGIEILETSNAIDRLVSTDAGDNQTVIIEGHTLSGSDFTFVVQTAILNGLTPVTLTTPLARTTRLYNTGATDFTGTITVYTNGGDTHLTALGADNQSLKCATAISSTDYWIITGIDVGVKRSNVAVVDFKLQVKEFGGVFRTQYFTSQSNGGNYYAFGQPLIIKPNSDVRMQVISNAASTAVSGSIHGFLALIQ